MTDHVAMITGAAGGIGGALVRSLSDAGVRVAALDARWDPLDRETTALAARRRVHPFVVDVADSHAVEEVIGKVEADLGPVRYLVNAAGVLRTGAAVELSDQDWDETFAVNSTGVFNVTRGVARRMSARGEGVIVTVASNAANVPRWHLAAYSASKAAATTYTKALGLELAQHGIRCNVVAPGSTDTAMLRDLHNGDADRALAASIAGAPETFRLGIPTGRVSAPQDVAEAVLFLLSDRASNITLQELTVDGGASLGA